MAGGNRLNLAPFADISNVISDFASGSKPKEEKADPREQGSLISRVVKYIKSMVPNSSREMESLANWHPACPQYPGCADVSPETEEYKG